MAPIILKVLNAGQTLLEFQAGAVLSATVSDPDGPETIVSHDYYVEMVQVAEQHGAVDADNRRKWRPRDG